MKEGDAITSYFHLHANHQRWKNHIAQSHHDVQVLVERARIEEAFVDHLKQLFSMLDDRQSTINFIFLGIVRHNLLELEGNFSEEGVKFDQGSAFGQGARSRWLHGTVFLRSFG